MLVFCGSANALLIAEYDLSSGTGGSAGTTKAATTVASGFSASSLTLTNADNNVGGLSSNHFYHNGWDTTLNLAKYYEATISSANAFKFSNVLFSLEEMNGSASTYWLRSSLDGFASDIATGGFSGGLVTTFDVDLSNLGTIAAPISFRWYMTASNLSERAGFANHEPGGLGGNLSDIGVDLQFHKVPVPATLVLFGIGLIGLGLGRRKKA